MNKWQQIPAGVQAALVVMGAFMLLVFLTAFGFFGSAFQGAAFSFLLVVLAVGLITLVVVSTSAIIGWVIGGGLSDLLRDDDDDE